MTAWVSELDAGVRGDIHSPRAKSAVVAEHLLVG
jgi:hypothetical protein